MNQTELRLSQIKSSLTWRDYDMADVQLSLLPKDDPKVVKIIDSIQSRNYEEALSLIGQYLNEPYKGLVEYQDRELDNLLAQMKELEEAIRLLEEQKSEQLFLLNEFNTQQCLVTGDITKQILHLRKEIEAEKLRLKQREQEARQKALEAEKARLEVLKKQRTKLESRIECIDELDSEYADLEEELEHLNEEIRHQRKKVKEKQQDAMTSPLFEETDESTFQEAEQEYEDYEESYQEAQEDKVAKLSPEDFGLLKKTYRKAARLCHPDVVAEDFKGQASEIMVQLNQACELGDIETVKAILVKLEGGMAFMLSSDLLTDKSQIEAKIHELGEKLEEINQEIEAINKNETWLLITSIDSWEGYFEEVKAELESYLLQLQQEYDALLV